MSKLTDRLKEAKGDRSIDAIATYATAHGHKISRSAVAKYLQDKQGPKPPVATLDALAVGFGLDPRELRELAGYTPGELGPWNPPDESASLTRDQREALDRLIKSMVRVEGDSDGGQLEAQKSSSRQGSGRPARGSRDDQMTNTNGPNDGGVTSIEERRRQKVIDQAQPVEEAADLHPVDPDFDGGEENYSQDPGDYQGPELP